MTTGGEGGMVTTDDEELWSRMWSYKDHGKSFDAVYHRKHAPGYRWVHESFGTNWRMLEMQAVLGRIQLRRMADWHCQRAAHAQRLWQCFSELSALRVPRPPAGSEHAWYKFYAYVQPEALSPDWTRDRIVMALNEAGVPCGVGSCSEIYLEKAFENTVWRPAQRLPVARRLGETSLMFMVHPTLGHREMDDTCQAVRKVMAAATA
jgi:dTDP-4-amino-4,6-dideoxygalactose transaminase